MPSTDKICRNLMLHRELMIVCCRPPLVMTTVIGKGGKMSISTHNTLRLRRTKIKDERYASHYHSNIHLRGLCTTELIHVIAATSIPQHLPGWSGRPLALAPTYQGNTRVP